MSFLSLEQDVSLLFFKSKMAFLTIKHLMYACFQSYGYVKITVTLQTVSSRAANKFKIRSMEALGPAKHK